METKKERLHIKQKQDKAKWRNCLLKKEPTVIGSKIITSIDCLRLALSTHLHSFMYTLHICVKHCCSR